MNKKLTVTKVALIIIACCAFLFAAAGFAVTALASEKNVSAIKIEIDYGNYDGRDLPKGKAGKSYPVFACTAFDNDGGAAEEIRITVKNSEGQTVPQKGGRFETASVGKYTIEYTAISGYVTATETITVEVESYVDTLKYDEEGENVPSSAKTGSVVLADFGTFSGGVGDLTIETLLTFGKTETALSETETGVYFIPEKCGSYTLSYVATDFVGDEKAVAKSIEIEDSAAPVVGKPSVPASAIGGETIEFPLPDGVLYKNGKKYYLPVTVYFDGEELGADMKAENLAVGEHTVKYVCENPFVKGAKTEYDYKLTVKGKGAEEGERIFDDYFDFVNCEPVTCDNKEYGVRVGKADVASFAFSRKIPVDYLNFDISTDSGVSAYSSVYFVMTDSENADDCVKVRIKKLSSYSSLYLSYDDETRTIKNLADGGAIILSACLFCNRRKQRKQVLSFAFQVFGIVRSAVFIGIIYPIVAIFFPLAAAFPCERADLFFRSAAIIGKFQKIITIIVRVAEERILQKGVYVFGQKTRSHRIETSKQKRT